MSGRHGHSATASATWRRLALVSIAGGIVPCPDALGILLIAVAAHRVALGLLIVVAFSTGLAFVLIALGLVITATRLTDRLERVPRIGTGISRWIPTVSALMMVFAGAAVLCRAVAAIA